MELVAKEKLLKQFVKYQSWEFQDNLPENYEIKQVVNETMNDISICVSNDNKYIIKVGGYADGSLRRRN